MRKIKASLLILIFCLCATQVFAADPYNLKCKAQSLLSVTTATAVTLEAAKVTHATYGPCIAVYVSVETNSIRRTFDGTTPTTGAAGVGGIIAAGSGMMLSGGSNVKNLKMIAVSATAPVQVDYFYETK